MEELTQMKRHAFAMRINSGCKGEYRQALGILWHEFTSFLDEHNMTNFSMWNVEDIVFGYYETNEQFEFTSKDKNIVNEWETRYGHLYTWISTPFEEMRLMYYDYGVVRESKELIRHSVFVTKLHSGEEEEYKRRHDALLEKRQGKINPGPDSNFSIWSAEGYIFGYDEIDITMETEPTEEEKLATIQWETKMLEIMSWLTNHVDWISGECHPAIQRIAWHN